MHNFPVLCQNIKYINPCFCFKTKVAGALCSPFLNNAILYQLF